MRSMDRVIPCWYRTTGWIIPETLTKNCCRMDRPPDLGGVTWMSPNTHDQQLAATIQSPLSRPPVVHPLFVLTEFQRPFNVAWFKHVRGQWDSKLIGYPSQCVRIVPSTERQNVLDASVGVGCLGLY